MLVKGEAVPEVRREAGRRLLCPEFGNLEPGIGRRPLLPGLTNLRTWERARMGPDSAPMPASDLGHGVGAMPAFTDQEVPRPDLVAAAAYLKALRRNG